MGARPGSHRVSLYFSDLGPIDRGFDLSPSADEIARQLKREHWPAVSDLARYLSITHFLGQSASQRFSVKQPKEQWEALRGPAGVDQINQLQDRIGGNATRMAFNRHLRQAAANVEGAQQSLVQWEDLLGRVIRLRQVSLASRAMPPAAVFDVCKAVVETVNASIRTGRAVENEAQSPEAALAEAGLVLREAQERHNVDQQRLSILASIVAGLDGVRSDLATSAALGEEAETRVASALETERVAAEQMDVAQQQLERTKGELSEAELALNALTRTVEAYESLQRSTSRLAATEHELAQVQDSEFVTQARSEELAHLIAEAEQRARQQEMLLERLTRLRASVSLAEEAAAIGIGEITNEFDRSAQLLEQVRRERIDLQEREAELFIASRGITEQLTALNQRQGEIAAAVTRIASLLRDSDTHCPVCATEFPTGELLTAVQVATRAANSDEERELNARLAELRVALADLGQQRLSVESREAEVVGLRSVLEGTRTRHALLLDDLAAVTGTREVSSPAEVERLIARFEEELQSLREVADGTVSLDELRRESSQIDAARGVLASSLERLRSERVRLVGGVEQDQAVLRQYPQYWSTETGLVEALGPARSAITSRIAALQSSADTQSIEVARRRAQLTAAQTERVNAQQSSDNYRVRVAQLVARQTQLRDEWLGESTAEEPSSAVIERSAETLQRRLLDISQANNLLEEAAVAFRSWLDDEELTQGEQHIAKYKSDLDAESEAHVTIAMEHRVRDAQDALERATRTRQRVDEVVERLRLEADQYAASVLQPLSSTIAEFADVLMTRGDGSLAYRAEHHSNRPELKPGILRRNSDGDSVAVDLNPNLFFSEGQLSALSVSALLAASTTFRWSRWPALLMDDPLQHNDVIHASAFIDLLNRLVKEAQYQVIVSTHDTAEADYITRKCRGSGVAFTRCDLPIRGRSGIVSQE
jgi:exonuclease SbcC